MICAGDELGRSQQGNNNAYCQDNEIGWIHWALSPGQADLLSFTRYMIQLRKQNPVLRRRKFFQGRSVRGNGMKDIVWYNPDGTEMNDMGWNEHSSRSLGVLLNGPETAEMDEDGNTLEGDTLFLMFHSGHEKLVFTLPEHKPEERWERVVDTADQAWNRRYFLRDHSYNMRPRSVVVLRLKPRKPEPAS